MYFSTNVKKWVYNCGFKKIEHLKLTNNVICPLYFNNNQLR